MCDVMIAEMKEDGSVQSTVIEGEVREFADLNKQTKERRDAQEGEEAERRQQEEDCRKVEAYRLDRATRIRRAKKKAYIDLFFSTACHLSLCIAVTLLARNHLLDVRVAWVAMTLATSRVTYKLGHLNGRFPHV